VHIVMFADQHVESLGGAQVSMRLQRRYLERAGHTVTIVAPALHGPRARAAVPARAAAGPAYVDLPSVPITFDREYSVTWPGAAADRRVDEALASRPPVDLVHVQADFWGGFIGHRFAARHGLPVVHTMHNRVDVGIEATTPLPGLVLRALNLWQRRTLSAGGAGAGAGAPVDTGDGGRAPGAGRGGDSAASVGADAEVGGRGVRSTRDGWAFLRGFAARSDAVTAPSSHFARRLEDHGVVPGRGGRGIRSGASGGADAEPRIDVVWNGIDDDLLDAALASAPEVRPPGPPRLVWSGRMSPEKRLLPFLEALAVSGVVADVEVIGGGAQLGAARRLLERHRAAATVTFAGRLPYPETLRRIAAADALVQTSIGFETQGMTVFEAGALGTPSVVSDPDIADELGAGVWRVEDASVDALAAALRCVASRVPEGTAPTPDPTLRTRFRQSSRTAAMLEVYRRVL
jgi:1,2-diacylglycerol 3-alpha-glucosyltransferase